MALHFEKHEYQGRLHRLQKVLAEKELDGILLFAQESMYWLTGYDTFGFCFFQAMMVSAEGEIALLTRAPDLRQAQHTSIIKDIRIWIDGGDANPAHDLKEMLIDMGFLGKKLGIEYKTVGLNGYYARQIDSELAGIIETQDASNIGNDLRVVKSQAELEYIRIAGKLSDDALDAAIKTTKAGAFEGDILAAMHNTIFSQGGDYAGNEFIIGSGKDALLCRYKSGRRHLSKNDQLTLEWSGAHAHYHAAMMRTLVIGEPSKRHLELYDASRDALNAVNNAMQVGNTISDMFQAHAKVMDDAGLSQHRLNACGYSMGASFTPCWMDPPMIYAGNEMMIEENMVFFTHMIIADSESETAMTLGNSYITSKNGPESLSRHEIDLILC